MAKINLKTFVSGNLSNNCYLVFDQTNNKGFVVDCPSPSAEIRGYIKEKGIDVLFVALTHAHFDHIAGLGDFQVPFYVHKDDKAFLKDSRLNGSAFFEQAVKIVEEPLLYPKNSELYFLHNKIEVIFTPGHTPGSVSLRLGNWLFSGDALFFDSVGRTDIPLASGGVLIKSLKERVMVLPDETMVYPGHGPSTSIGRERKHNPFLRNANGRE
ncbi:MAG: MBL fold metallo-hydrolase [Candidatus Omnitrophota bacterium]